MPKTAIITDGSREVGEAMSRKLAQMGYQLVINFRNTDSQKLAENLTKKITGSYGIPVIAFRADLERYADCESLIGCAVKMFGEKIDVLVNNFAMGSNRCFQEVPEQQYFGAITSNLTSQLHMCHLALPYLANHDSAIVNVSSAGGDSGNLNPADYCAARAGVIGLTRALALEYGRHRVRVNAIAPERILTGVLRSVNQEDLRVPAAGVPQEYAGEPGEISGCLEYILTAACLTGQTISAGRRYVTPKM